MTRRIIFVSRSGYNNEGNRALTKLVFQELRDQATEDEQLIHLDRTSRFGVEAIRFFLNLDSGFLRSPAHLSQVLYGGERPGCVFRALAWLVHRSPWRVQNLLARVVFGEAGFDHVRRNLAISYLRRRLELFKGAGAVIVNPAGEFHRRADTEALPYVFDIMAADLCDAHAFAINFSFEFEDRSVAARTAAALKICEIVWVRDTMSQSALSQYDCDSRVAPDCVALEFEPTEAAERKRRDGEPRPLTRIGLGISMPAVARERLDTAVSDLAHSLERAGYRIELISNEWKTDEQHLQASGLAKFPRAEVGRGLSYRESLEQYDVVVSSRLHTCLLALCAGTPVVPLENFTFKVSGLMKELGLPAPIQIGSADLIESVLNRLGHIGSNLESVREENDRALIAAKARCTTMIGDMMSAARVPH